MPAIHSTVHQQQRTSGPPSAPNAPTPRRLVRATLAVAGGVAVATGAAIALAPRSFIDIEGEPTADLLSETRSPGVVLLVTGAFILIAALRQRHLHAAATMATLTYLGYGLARAASLIVDGRPSGTIVGAMIVELVLGVASLAALMSLANRDRVAQYPG